MSVLVTRLADKCIVRTHTQSGGHRLHPQWLGMEGVCNQPRVSVKQIDPTVCTRDGQQLITRILLTTPVSQIIVSHTSVSLNSDYVSTGVLLFRVIATVLAHMR